jgi:hypothetical protein
MRIHSDLLSVQDFADAARRAGVTVVGNLGIHRSQSRTQAFTFTLSGNGRNGGQWGNQPHKTATWDEWGIVFAHLFDVDPLAHTGKWPYQSGEHFDWATGGRFRTLTPASQHLRHKWNRALGPSLTGSYYVSECDCGAIQRVMADGRRFGELVS